MLFPECEGAIETACAARKAKDVVLSLVDSEDLPAAGHFSWQHLRARQEDRWEKPVGAGDEDAFLMIALMETWIIADEAALWILFKRNFRDGQISQWPNLEKVPKEAVYQALKAATLDRYEKGQKSFALLGSVDLLVVESKCGAAKLLLARLRSLA